MGDDPNTAGRDGQAEVVSEFDPTDDWAPDPPERDSVFEDAMICIENSPMRHGVRSHSRRDQQTSRLTAPAELTHRVGGSRRAG